MLLAIEPRGNHMFISSKSLARVEWNACFVLEEVSNCWVALAVSNDVYAHLRTKPQL